jgi:hypothetical protein
MSGSAKRQCDGTLGAAYADAAFFEELEQFVAAVAEGFE